MDFEAIIDRECPAPIHWLTHRRYVIGRVKYEVEKRDARLAALESTERELREALKVLAGDIADNAKRISKSCRESDVAWEDVVNQKVLANPIAAAAVREAGK